MGKLIVMNLKVIKPPLTNYAMCVYRFYLDTGFYYYGATTDLGDRICCHLKQFRNGTNSKLVKDAMAGAKTITFEIIRFVNDRKDLGKWEEHFLSKNVGLPLCLNVFDFISTSYTRNESLYKVAKVGKDGVIVKTYESVSKAAIDNKIAVSTIISNCNAKYPISKTYFRRLNKNGEIITPSKPMRENVSGKKAVRQYDKEMNFIAQFESLSEAARIVRCDRKNISDILKGKSYTAVGFTFREVDENGNDIQPVYLGKKKKKRREGVGIKTPKKPVCKTDAEGNILETYRSLYMAMKSIPIERRQLSSLLKFNKPFNGYFYKYA